MADADVIGLSIVVPVYSRLDDVSMFFNELVSELPRIRTSMKLCSKFELIFVDDGGKESLTDSHFSKYEIPSDLVVRVIRLSRNFGQHEALVCGYKESKGSIVIRFNSDNANLCKYIPEIVEALSTKPVDRCTLTGEKPGPISSRVMNRIQNSMFSVSSPYGAMPARGYTRRYVDAILHVTSSSNYTLELEDWIGFETFNLPVTGESNSRIRSSYNLRKRLDLAFSIFALRSTNNFQNLAILTTGVLMLALLLAVLLVASSLFLGLGGNGFVTLALLQIFFSSILLAVQSIIGVIVSKVMREAQKRPSYIIKDQLIVKTNS